MQYLLDMVSEKLCAFYVDVTWGKGREYLKGLENLETAKGSREAKASPWAAEPMTPGPRSPEDRIGDLPVDLRAEFGEEKQPPDGAAELRVWSTPRSNFHVVPMRDKRGPVPTKVTRSPLPSIWKCSLIALIRQPRKSAAPHHIYAISTR
jgi:hypothetical protein